MHVVWGRYPYPSPLSPVPSADCVERLQCQALLFASRNHTPLMMLWCARVVAKQEADALAKLQKQAAKDAKAHAKKLAKMNAKLHGWESKLSVDPGGGGGGGASSSSQPASAASNARQQSSPPTARGTDDRMRADNGGARASSPQATRAALDSSSSGSVDDDLAAPSAGGRMARRLERLATAGEAHGPTDVDVGGSHGGDGLVFEDSRAREELDDPAPLPPASLIDKSVRPSDLGLGRSGGSGGVKQGAGRTREGSIGAFTRTELTMDKDIAAAVKRAQGSAKAAIVAIRVDSNRKA
jgi:hypothetical protein